ncbi:hypothetical protein L1887_59500 [Cichorium endivia]|nr:hypothetical protein L1887_59500 [Cichorium endivia]
MVGFWPMANAVEQKKCRRNEAGDLHLARRMCFLQGNDDLPRLEQVDLLSLRLKAESMAHMMLTAVEYGIWALAMDEQCEQMKYGQSGFCTDVVMPCLSLKDDNNAH